MSSLFENEARRQFEICNACRYCENICAVFPAVHARRKLSNENIAMLADVCHNCRACYYACQYTEPHEFALNLPAVLADVRQANWEKYAVPVSFARAFQRNGLLVALLVISGMAGLLAVVANFSPLDGKGFYGVLGHDSMIALFLPAFVIPLLLIAVSVRRYWRAIGGGKITLESLRAALSAAASMRNLSGGHGKGCNFEDEDRFSMQRRWYHHATMYGFLLCFAATSVATVMHYFFALPAPYPFWSLPKLLGVFGGILLCCGTVGLAVLKLKAERKLGSVKAWGGEMGFVILLFSVSASGLALYWLGASDWLTGLVVIHLGSVLAFFLLMPYTKMVHGFFKIAALIKVASEK